MTQDTARAEQKHFFHTGVKPDVKSYRPLVFNYQDEALRNLFQKSHPVFHDELEWQIKGLIKVRNPALASDQKELDQLYQHWVRSNDLNEHGLYVYYPWSNRVVHVLPESEFIELRTARNKHKITAKEQAELSQKCVAIIGLSVGQSVALTMALERSCGYLKLADFDTLELSNLNRIRTGIKNLGLTKTIIAAREIAEIDPFIEVEIFEEGIRRDNVSRFLDNSPSVDLLIEECDDLQVKIESRKAARSRGIPVLMDTSDRGMLDIERFDLNSNRPLFHDLVPDIDKMDLESLSPEQRIGVLLKLVGGLNISDRLKASLLELNQSITSWPQLSSSVSLGSGFTGDIARKILLKTPVKSGRYYADPDDIVPIETTGDRDFTPPPSVELDQMVRHTQGLAHLAQDIPPESLIKEAAKYAGMAPSSGNDQPWLFYYSSGVLAVFQNRQRSFSFGDHQNFASIQSIGAAIENLILYMGGKAYDSDIQYFPDGKEGVLIAALSFRQAERPTEEAEQLLSQIPKRVTNREIVPKVSVHQELLESLSASISLFDEIGVKWMTDEELLLRQGQIIADCDKIRVFNAWGHHDFFNREMRWTPQQAEQSGDGIDIRGLGIDPQNLLAIQILKNYNVVSTLSEIDGGKSFDTISLDAARSASAMGLITTKNLNNQNLLNGGRAWERLWLKATGLGLSFHPLISPLYLFNRMINGGEEVLDAYAVERLKELWPDFKELWNLGEEVPIFMFRIFYTEKDPIPSQRLEIDQIYFSDGHKD